MALPIFPRNISIKYNSTKEMSWKTTVKRSGSNKIRTLTTYRYPKWQIKVSAVGLTNEDVRSIQGFFALLRGANKPFLWLDQEDYQEKNVLLGIGDGVTKSFFAIRRLGQFAEPITDIKTDSLVVYVNNKKVTAMAGENGEIVLMNPPAKGDRVTADYTYYWRVILEKDTVNVKVKFNNINEIDSFTLGVVR